MSDAPGAPEIWVIAGTNGAGKSSVRGEAIRAKGRNYFNPDEAARELMESRPGSTFEQASGEAWRLGKELLERAIRERRDFAFETTLGGRTITQLLHEAIRAGVDVRMWYVALASPEMHIARVRSRVAAGGHDISEAKIRERYDESRKNLISLMPGLAELQLYDNSTEGDPKKGLVPEPRLLLHVIVGRIKSRCDLATVPDWAKPMFAVALRPRV